MVTEGLNFSSMELYAINVGNSDGIPAVEQDMTTGQYNLLVFTSEEAARRYCYLQQPKQVDSIYRMERRRKDGNYLQSGLLRVARTCLSNYKQVSGVIFDHPGGPGLPVTYATIEAVASSVKRLVPKEKVKNGDLVDYLMQADYEDSNL
jgi:hypothetical protein